jgi:WD40 repeat protein
MSNLNLPTNNDHLVSPFPSLECIWEEHGKLLDKLEDIENIGKGDKENLVASGLINDIEQFMKRVRETGRFFDDRKNNQERPSSQSLLDYWSTVLYRYNCQPTDKTLKNFEKSKLVDLSKQGDNFYRGLDETEELKNLADSILLQLVHLEAGNKVVRTPKHRQDLYNLGAPPTDVDLVLEGLVKSQVIYQNTASDNTEKTEFGLAYEGLAYYWKYLKDLLQEKQEKTKERQQLTEIAKQWEVSGKKNEFLWRGELLRKAAEYQDLDLLENEFIRQSQKIENKTLVTQKNLLCGLVVIAIFFAGIAGYQLKEANELREKAEQLTKLLNQINGTSNIIVDLNQLDPKVTLLSALAALYDIKQTPNLSPVVIYPVENKLRQGLKQVISESFYSTNKKLKPLIPTTVAAYTEDNNYAITTVIPDRNQLSNRKAIVWNLQEEQPKQLVTLNKTGSFQIIGTALNGNFLFTTTKYADWEIWDIKNKGEKYNQSLPQQLPGQKELRDYPTAITFSNQDKWVAIASRDGAVRLWEWKKKNSNIIKLFEKPKREDPSTYNDYIISVAFDPKAENLVSTYSNGWIRLWKLLEVNKNTTTLSTPQRKLNLSDQCNLKDDYIIAVKFRKSDVVEGISAKGRTIQWNIKNGDCQEINRIIKPEDLKRLYPLIRLTCKYLNDTKAIQSDEADARKAKAVCEGH